MVNSPWWTLSLSTRTLHFEVGWLIGSKVCMLESWNIFIYKYLQSKIPVLVLYILSSQLRLFGTENLCLDLNK